MVGVRVDGFGVKVLGIWIACIVFGGAMSDAVFDFSFVLDWRECRISMLISTCCKYM